MRKFLFFFLVPGIAYANTDLSVAVDNARNACVGIAKELSSMKTLAGAGVAVSSVGTIAGGVALGTGIAKAQVDKKADELETELAQEIEKLNQLSRSQHSGSLAKIIIPDSLIQIDLSANQNNSTTKEFDEKQKELARLNDKSKKLGDWRTGTISVNAATNIASMAMASSNRVKGDLKTKINECLDAVQTLSNVHMQARISQTADEATLTYTGKIVSACQTWKTVNIDSINNNSTGAAISSGVGAGLGLAGTVTSATANSQKVRQGDSDKEKNLNTASNILAGGTTVASGVAVVFNAIQIKAIKQAEAVAKECEEALK